MLLLLACRRLGLFLIYGVYAVDRLLHERPTLANTSINLLGQDLEALIAEKNRPALLRFRKRGDNGQMITRVQRDGLGDHPHIAVEVVKLGVQTVEMLAQYLAHRIIAGLPSAVRATAIEVEVEENFGQSAAYREELGEDRGGDEPTETY